MIPDQTGGELLPATEGYDYLGGNPFSVSPDGRWLLFSRSDTLQSNAPTGDLEADMLRSLSAYVLYDLRRSEGSPVALGADVPDFAERSGGSFVPSGGCWIPREDRWLAAVSDAYGQYLVVDPSAASPEWIAAESEAFAFRDYCPVEDKYSVPDVIGRFRLAEPRGRRIVVLDADDPTTVLARHRAPRFPGIDVSLSGLRLAPEGTLLAYSVSSAFGSLAGGSTAFVLSRDASSGPSPLASTVDAIRWGADDSTLFAAVRLDSARGIYRWRSPLTGTGAGARPGDGMAMDGDGLSPFSEDVMRAARVLENSTACIVDAVCHLRLEFADTSILVVYGSGERPADDCEVPRDVSDLAFEAQNGDLVEVVVSQCASGDHYLRRLTRLK